MEKEAEPLEGRALADKLNELEVRQRQVRIELRSIENVIKMDEPDWDRSKIRPTATFKYQYGSDVIADEIYQVIQESEGRPMKARETAHKVIERLLKKGLPPPKSVLSIDQAVRDLFGRLEDNGLRRIEGRPLTWALDAAPNYGDA